MYYCLDEFCRENPMACFLCIKKQHFNCNIDYIVESDTLKQRIQSDKKLQEDLNILSNRNIDMKKLQIEQIRRVKHDIESILQNKVKINLTEKLRVFKILYNI